MGEGKKTPEIRFKGFGGEWKLQKLGKVVNLENGFAFKSKYFQDEPTDVVVLTPGSVNIGGGFQEGKGRFYDVAGDFPKQFIFKPDDIFVTMTDLTPTAQALGFPAVVPDDGKTYLHNQRLGKLIGFEGDKSFLFQLLSTEKNQKKIVLTSSGTTVKHTSPRKILDCKSCYPSKKEQTKIGNYFQQLDNLIALHQQKYDKLLNVKKAMLEKTFPKKGADVPEIRFKGFSEKWVERILFHVVDVRSGRDYKHLSKGNIPVYGTGGYMLYVNEALSYDEDAIGIGRKGTIDKPYILKAPFWTVDTLFYAVPKKENDLQFVYSIFQKINWKQKDESTGVPSLSKVAINGIQIFITKTGEQSKIGTFFKKIDTLLGLHKNQLEKLKNIKKACLEKMFV